MQVSSDHVPTLVQALHSSLVLLKESNSYPEFCVPIYVVPATISNNVPGTGLSVGCDTFLNVVMEVRASLFAVVVCFFAARRQPIRWNP